MRSAIVAALILLPLAHPALARPSLCGAQEVAVFSCRVGGGKIVSLCASPDLSESTGTLRYLYGRPGAVELTYPDRDVRPHTVFRRGPIAAGGGDFVRFDRQGTTYTIEYWDGPRAPNHYYAAVRVHRGAKQIAEIRCSSRTEDALGDDGWLRVYRANIPSGRYELD